MASAQHSITDCDKTIERDYEGLGHKVNEAVNFLHCVIDVLFFVPLLELWRPWYWRNDCVWRPFGHLTGSYIQAEGNIAGCSGSWR